jgi:cbb3-type cytochrome oxidase maturation protein
LGKFIPCGGSHFDAGQFGYYGLIFFSGLQLGRQKTFVDMNIVFPLIGISLTMALIFLGAFIWSVRSGQQDDLYTPSVRILFDDDKEDIEKK